LRETNNIMDKHAFTPCSRNIIFSNQQNFPVVTHLCYYLFTKYVLYQVSVSFFSTNFGSLVELETSYCSQLQRCQSTCLFTLFNNVSLTHI